MTETRTVVDSICIYIDRDALNFSELKEFVDNNKDVDGVLEYNYSSSNGTIATWDLVVYS